MRLRVALVAAAVSLALPAVASAETFCPNDSTEDVDARGWVEFCTEVGT